MVIKVGRTGSRRTREECGRCGGRDDGGLEQGSGNGEPSLGLRAAEAMSNRAWR